MVDVDIIIASTSPPAVAAARPRASFRRKAYIPRPASSGLKTMKIRSAGPGENSENSTVGGAYSHPLWGSAANRYPAISNGFHSGIRPAATASPRKDHRGSQKVRRSGCWFVSAPSMMNPRSAKRTEPTIRSGPSHEATPSCRARREPARIRVVHAGQTTARSPVSRKTSGRVGRPHLQVVFLTP